MRRTGPRRTLLFRPPVVAASSSWAPTDLGANLVGWWDASAASSVLKTISGTVVAADGESVERWVDQSGNGRHLDQSTSARRPIYRTSSNYNSKKAVDFAAASNHYLQTTAQTISSNATTLSFFVVTRMETGTSNNARVGAFTTRADYLALPDFDDAQGALLIGMANGTNAVQGAHQYTASGGITISSAISLDTNYRFGYILNGTNEKLYVNGTQTDSDTCATPTMGSAGGLRVGADICQLGSSNPPSEWWDGPVCEIILAKTAVTSDVSNIETYLTTKWGS